MYTYYLIGAIHSTYSVYARSYQHSGAPHYDLYLRPVLVPSLCS